MNNFFLFLLFIFSVSCKSNFHKKKTVATKTETVTPEGFPTASAKNKEILKQQANTIVKTNIIETSVKEKNTTAIKTPESKKVKLKKRIPTNSHAIWNSLLTKYVSNEGDVDYKGLLTNTHKLQEYLEDLNYNAPNSSWTKNKKLAYYINLYNAATIKLILDNYPTESIKNLRKPWSKAIVKIGNQLISLGDLEHTILRKMNEPRIHFAINCASYSCPKLLNIAFTANNVEMLLEETTRDFINDTTRNIIQKNNIELSEIFRWYKKDFMIGGTLITYLNKYSKTAIVPNAKISYLKYDWSLNERR